MKRDVTEAVTKNTANAVIGTQNHSLAVRPDLRSSGNFKSISLRAGVEPAKKRKTRKIRLSLVFSPHQCSS